MTERSARMILDHQVHRWRNRSRRRESFCPVQSDAARNRKKELCHLLTRKSAADSLNLMKKNDELKGGWPNPGYPPFCQVNRTVMISAMTNAAAQIDSSVTLLADSLTNKDSHALFQIS